MNLSLLAAFPAVAVAVSTLASPFALAADPLPAGLTGSLGANPAIVQVGQSPKLSWSINYPSIVKDYVTITPPATVVPKENLYCDVRVLGAGVTVTTNGNGYTFVPTKAVMSYNSTSNYKQIFYGTNPQVNPSQALSTSGILTNSKVEANKPVRFGGQYYYNNTWGTLYTSTSGTDNVRVLVNGDVPPSNVPDYNAPSLESFLRPYLDTTGRVKIGPMDVIVFMELTHTSSQKSDPGYDLQDLVLLVTFRKN